MVQEAFGAASKFFTCDLTIFGCEAYTGVDVCQVWKVTLLFSRCAAKRPAIFPSPSFDLLYSHKTHTLCFFLDFELCVCVCVLTCVREVG